MTEYFNDLNKMSTGELKAIIATGKHPYVLTTRSTTTDQDIIADVETILNKRRLWHEKGWGKIIIGLLIGIIVLVATLFVNKYFTTKVPQQQSLPPQREAPKK